MKVTQKEVFSVPNILSYIRILLIPVIIYIYLHATERTDYYVVGFLVLLSGLTDLLDGWIARKFNQITEIGKIIDPIADKLTQFAIVLLLLFQYAYMWILVTLFVIKELFLGINGLILLKRNQRLDGAKWFGKVSTAVFYVTMGILMTFPWLDTWIIATLMIITGVFLLLAFVLYTLEYYQLYRNKPEV